MTFLWRAMGSPEPVNTVNPFADVAQDAYYYKAVLWAVENGVTSGTSATTFSPDMTCSHASILTFLWANAGKPGQTGQGAWYEDAVNWADSKEMLLENVAGLDAQKDCPRSDIVTYLYRQLGRLDA